MTATAAAGTAIASEEALERTARLCRERGIAIPTFAELADPNRVPEAVRRRLRDVGMQDVHPLNLYRITWKNEPVERGGLFGGGNWLELPPELTGVRARIVALAGRYFPTGAHKVGAAFGCLVPALVTGRFDPVRQKAAWPSTGNFCRGGAFDCALLACRAVAILPEGMSRERFEWLRRIGTDEVITTPGGEANVKEIYDRCAALRRERGGDVAIFNQFEEMGNATWHYHATGSAVEDVFRAIGGPDARLAAFVSATGSAGTIAAGDRLRASFPLVRVVAVEAVQCPTLLEGGYGDHRIEGIGDKHVPWIHNVMNTDAVAGVDDERCLRLLRLFNEDEGRAVLERAGVAPALVERLGLFGISGICNLVASIMTARRFALGPRDVIFTVLTDSVDLYRSRLEELRRERGPYCREDAARDRAGALEAIAPEPFLELDARERRRLHNLKYFTWVEQQGRTVEELDRLRDPDFWTETFARVEEWDGLIRAFNERTGVLAGMERA